MISEENPKVEEGKRLFTTLQSMMKRNFAIRIIVIVRFNIDRITFNY